MKRRILLIVYTILSFHVSESFSQQIIFEPLKNTSETNSNQISGFTRDQLGFAWLSIWQGGMSRYDGLDFVNFQHNSTNSNSLSSNNATCIYADDSGKIWIGMYETGIDIYDPSSNSFTHFRHDPKNNLSLGFNNILAIAEDHLGNIWIGTYGGGLDMYDRKSGNFKHFKNQPGNKTSLSNNFVRTIYEDHQGTVWFGCGDPFNPGDSGGGLNKYDPVRDNFTRYLHDPANPNSLTTNKVTALFEDSKGNFWVGTSGDGLHIMDRKNGSFEHFFYDSLHPEKLSRPILTPWPNDYVSFINEDILGGIWIGSASGGVNRYDPRAKKITHFGASMSNAATFELNVIQDTASGFKELSTGPVLFSSDGTILLSTMLTKYSPLYRIIITKTIPFYKNRANTYTFFLDSDSILWTGTDLGLVRKDLKSKKEELFKPDPKNAYGLNSNSIIQLRMDNEKNLWLATMGAGLTKFDTRTNIFTKYNFDPKNKLSIRNDYIGSLCMDHNNELWVGTQHGLDKMDRRTGDFIHYDLEKNAMADSNNNVVCIREDQNKDLWIATNLGLYRIHISNGGKIKFLEGSTYAVCVDSKNDIWSGSDTTWQQPSKLYRFNRSRNQFETFVIPNSGDSINGVNSIIEDQNQALWIGTTDALVKINDQREMITKYGTRYGVYRNPLQAGDNYMAGNGQLFFGFIGGYYSFFPDDMKENAQAPQLNFTKFRLNGVEVIPNAGSVLKLPVWQTKDINLSYRQNSFSFEFTGMNFQNPEGMEYHYVLENYDEAWHITKTERLAYYFNVPPGRYIFHMKVFNDSGGWSEKSIAIIISPPWYKTWWAYALFALLIIGSLGGFISYRSQKLRRENRLLEEKVVSRTNELKQSLVELKATQTQLIQSEKMVSLGELTAGIAHEIQNPLNFVNNFSEVNTELIAEMNEKLSNGNFEEAKMLARHVEENERKIMQHGKRADAIVKGMLQHSRVSTGEKEPTDLNALLNEYLILSYHGFRAKDKTMHATLRKEFDPAVGKVNIIPQDIGRVLLNLCNNAFYAVLERKLQERGGFEPVVSVSSKRLGNKVEIRVSDNGKGVPQKITDKIFQPFFTTKPTGTGTGLGLSLSYDIMKAHDGDLKLVSVEGAGAVFVILFPV